MKLQNYKITNEYYLPKDMFDLVIKEAKIRKQPFYGFDVFQKTTRGKKNIEIADFSNSKFEYDYGIELSNKIIKEYKDSELLFSPVFEDDGFLEGEF